LFISETNNTNGQIGRATLFSLVFGKQTLVSKSS